ncbi:methyl-accepting chemotaxis protein [Undibacterium sp. TJN25]
MNFSNLKISMRLAIAFGTLMFVMLAMIVSNVERLTEIGSKNTTIIDKNWIGASAALEIDALTQENGSRTLELFIRSEQGDRIAQYKAIDDNRKKIDALVQQFAKVASTVKEKEALSRFVAAHGAFIAAYTKVADLIEEDRRDDAVALLTTVAQPALNSVLAVMNDIISLQKNEMAGNGREIKTSIAFSRTLALGFGFFALLISALFSFFITRSITRPLNVAVAAARRVADGDLTGSIDVNRTDEAGQLLSALSGMNASLTSAIAQVHEGTHTIAAASDEIAAGNANLASRTATQNSALQEISASMHGLTAAVRQNAGNAGQANLLVMSASEVATKGGQVVGEVVLTMGAIRESSRKIVDIIGVIDDIAFQTNILALNAAVEAARAGTQGRGFAVVAGEVRNLAQRSAVAAKEIKELIGSSVERVDHGTELTDKAGKTMQDILLSIRQVTEIMSAITATGRDQSVGIEQVNLAITQMDEITRQNSALVEQATATAQNMHGQSMALAHAVSLFRLHPSVKVPGLAGGLADDRAAMHFVPAMGQRGMRSKAPRLS